MLAEVSHIIIREKSVIRAITPVGAFLNRSHQEKNSSTLNFLKIHFFDREMIIFHVPIFSGDSRALLNEFQQHVSC